MLKYNHVYNNTDATKPYNIACIDSDSDNVAIYINGELQEITSPNVSKDITNLTFNTHTAELSQETILNLIYSGTLVNYKPDINKAIFSQINTVYISYGNSYLNLNSDGSTYLSQQTRSKFFFNPYFFDSNYLWSRTFKTKKIDKTISGLWDELTEIKLFNSIKYTVTNSMPVLRKVEPIKLNYFISGTATRQIYLNNIIQFKATSGDKIKLVTDKDKLEFDYEPISNSHMVIPNIDNTTCTRPWIHIPVKTFDPNTERLYTKILNKGVNNFNLTVNESGKTFTKNLTITR